MFIGSPREFDSPYSPEECRQRLRDASLRWRQADNWSKELWARLFEIKGRLYVLASRRIRYFGRVPFRHACCKLNLAASGRGTRVSAVFINHLPICILMMVVGLILTFGTLYLEMKSRIELKPSTLYFGLVTGTLMAAVGYGLIVWGREQEKQDVMDLLETTLQG